MTAAPDPWKRHKGGTGGVWSSLLIAAVATAAVLVITALLGASWR